MTETSPLGARAPGRVVLIGDHTDYTGGLVCSMAIDRWTRVAVHPARGPLRITSENSSDPGWHRYVDAVAAELGVDGGFEGSVTTTIPVGAGLSSSAALEVATALALGFAGTPLELAQLCQRAEHAATGLPSGILDQLTSACGVEGHTLVLDCHDLSVRPVRLPEGVAVWVRFIAHRQLVGSPYAERVAQCAAAEAIIGPLRVATFDQLDAIDDPIVRRRARHVITENQRVRDFAAALAVDDVVEAGRLMNEGHESLRLDYETSTPEMDAAAASARTTPGVHGARMTGGGFGGCVVALAASGVELPGAWRVHPVGPATRLV